MACRWSPPSELLRRGVTRIFKSNYEAIPLMAQRELVLREKTAPLARTGSKAASACWRPAARRRRCHAATTVVQSVSRASPGASSSSCLAAFSLSAVRSDEQSCQLHELPPLFSSVLSELDC